ncbi:Fe-S cluster assembly ATPase SufC [Candidatus Gracilibacteria bacterium]|nr:Fe-S cluster assembly ATPase SufC [Candidatus Gracilibacteria bacterium]
MLVIKNLHAKVADTEILHGIDLSFEKGKNTCILGKNGSGKSSLASIVMGNPAYEVTDGSITLDNENLLTMSPEERSLAGIFLSFQNVTEIKGIKVSEYLRTIYNLHLPRIAPGTNSLSPMLFARFVKSLLTSCDIPEAFLERDLNVGFSGGEKRKLEVLQLKLLQPTYIILDEIDSGLDLDAFKLVAKMLSESSGPDTSIIIITHYFEILESFQVDQVVVMDNGVITRRGGSELATEIRQKGFKE